MDLLSNDLKFWQLLNINLCIVCSWSDFGTDSFSYWYCKFFYGTLHLATPKTFTMEILVPFLLFFFFFCFQNKDFLIILRWRKTPITLQDNFPDFDIIFCNEFSVKLFSLQISFKLCLNFSGICLIKKECC